MGLFGGGNKDDAPTTPRPGNFDPRAAAQQMNHAILYKQGLDLQLKELDDGCRRIWRTERRLQNKLHEVMVSAEGQYAEAAGLADGRTLKQLAENERIIEQQALEMEELRFQRDVLKDETRRLQALARAEPPDILDPIIQRNRWRDTAPEIPLIHSLWGGYKQGLDERIRFPTSMP
jgi:hypothetical protein